MASNDKELWKQIPLPKGSTTRNYAVSTHGRLASFDGNMNDKLILKLHNSSGFPRIGVNINGKSKAIFPHHAIGAVFIKKHNPKCKYVIHLDHNKENNHISNLKWATPKEQIEHNKKSPHVLKAIKNKVYTGGTAKKLNEKKVVALKKEIWNPKRKLTMKQLAEKYGIAEMNLYRIKSGELWFHVHVEGEPLHAKYKQQLKNIELKEKAEKKALTRSATKAAVTSRASVTKATKKVKPSGPKKSSDKKSKKKNKK
jgi:hypothetical protein